jgi:hypothetical protein
MCKNRGIIHIDQLKPLCQSETFFLLLLHRQLHTKSMIKHFSSSNSELFATDESWRDQNIYLKQVSISLAHAMEPLSNEGECFFILFIWQNLFIFCILCQRSEVYLPLKLSSECIIHE